MKLGHIYDQAARAGVVIYTLDVRGLQTGLSVAGDASVAASRPVERRTTMDSLWVIAHETGRAGDRTTPMILRPVSRASMKQSKAITS